MSIRDFELSLIGFLVLFLLLLLPSYEIVAQEKVAPINLEGLRRWYSKQELPIPEYAHPLVPREISATEVLASSDTADVRLFPSANPQTENSIAISTFNPQHLFVATNGAAVSTGTTWFFSTNGGGSWFGSETSPNSVSNSGDPVALFDASGNSYWVALASGLSNIKVARTTNLGASWTITDADPTGGFDDKEHAMTDLSSVYPNNIYVAWTDFNFSPGRVVLTRSTNSGSTWSSRTGFNIGSDVGHGANIAIGPAGEVYVAFASYGGGLLPETGMRFAKSTDGGGTWSTASVAFPVSGIRLTNGPSAAFNNTRVNSFPSMGVDRSTGPRRGWIYMTYADRSTGDADIYLRRSTDGGISWSAGIRVNGETVGNGKQQWLSSIAVDPTNGGISVSYYSMDSTGFLTARYIAHSMDGGDSWERIRVSDVRFTPTSLPPPFSSGYMGDYYETAAFGGKAWTCWSDDRSGIFQAYVSKLTYSENFGWVRGTVTASGSPLIGVSVDFVEPVQQQGGASQSSGSYLSGAKVDTPSSASLYTLRARKFGYTDFTDTVTLVRADTVLRNITLIPAPGGSLTGRVFNSDSAGVRANVQIRFNGVLVVSDLFSDSVTGDFVHPLPNGTYDVTVDPPTPYRTRQFAGIVINSDTPYVSGLVRFVLEPSPLVLLDTLGVEQSNTINLTLTNTTSDSIHYRISNDEAGGPFTSAPRKLFDDRSPSKDPNLILAKGEHDPRFGSPVILGKGGPDTFGYKWTDSDEPGGPAFSWVDISSVGTQIFGLGDDNTTAPISMGFEFSFYGNTYNTIRVCSNGFLSFTSANSSFSNTVIPNSGEPNNALFAWWTDLNFNSGGSAYYYFDALNQRFVVQFNNVPHYGSGGPYTFEIILKPSGEILYQYLSMISPLTSSSIGIEDFAGITGSQVVFNNSFVHDNLAVRFKPGGVSWLTHTPMIGTIASGGSAVIVNTFDATDLIPNTEYHANIMLDPVHPDVTESIIIPAHLAVRPISGPGIYVRPLVKNIGNVFLLQSKTDTLRLRNIGDSTLTISELFSTDPHFTISPPSAMLLSGDSMRAFVTFAPTDSGLASATIHIVSNDPLNDTVNVSVSGMGIPVPHFAARVDSLTKSLEGGTQDSVRFYLRNDGSGSGNFSARAIIYPQTTLDAAAQTFPVVIPLRLQDRLHPIGMKTSVANTPANLPAVGQETPVDNPLAQASPKELEINGMDRQKYDLLVTRALENRLDDKTKDRLQTAVRRASSDPAASPFQLMEDFERTDWPWSPWITVLPGGSTTSGCAHEGVRGIQDPEWHYRSDLVVGSEGEKISMWIKAGSGRSYAGFGATSAGCWSLVAASNSGELIIQRNAGFDFSQLAAVSQSWTVGVWYMLEINFENNGLVIGKVYSADGTTLLNTISTTITGFTPGGIAVRSFGNFCIDEIGVGSSAQWLTISPSLGTIAQGDSLLATAVFDATSSVIFENPGNYFGRVEIAPANSSYADSLIIPVRMTVIPPPGSRLMVNLSAVDFDSVEVSASRQKNIRVKNIGASSLIVTNILTTNPEYTVSPMNFTLASMETLGVTVTYAPTTPGQLLDTLRFVSNDASSRVVALTGVGLGFPNFSVIIDSVVASLDRGSKDTVSFVVRNTGSGNATYSARAFINPPTSASSPSARSRVLPVAMYSEKELSAETPSARNIGHSPPSVGLAPRRPTNELLTESRSGRDLMVLSSLNAYCVSASTVPPPPPGGPPPLLTSFNKFALNQPCCFTQIAANPGDIYGGDFATDGNFYGMLASTGYQLVRLDPESGAQTIIGPLSAVAGEYWTGLAIDPLTGLMYGASTNNFHSTLYHIDIYTGSTTVIGTITNAPGIITIAINNTGQMYGVDIIEDALVGINPLTGAGTYIGAIGFDANYAQDADFDPATGVLFFAAFNGWTYRAELRTVNLSTGWTTLVDLLPSQQQVTAFGIAGGTSAQWLSARPAIGQLAIGDSVSMRAIFDVTDSSFYDNPGTFFGGIEMIAMNSSVADTLRVPARLTVIPSLNARLRVAQDSLGFGDVEIGAIKTLSVLVKNIGATQLTVTNITSSHTSYSATPTSFMLNYLDTQRVSILFTGSTPLGFKNGALSFSSNDLSAPTLKVTGRVAIGTWENQRSGTITTLNSVSLLNEHVAWAVGSNGTALRTTDGGVTWLTVQSLGNDAQNVSSVDANTALVCVNPSTGNTGLLYRTTDGGSSWSQVLELNQLGAHLNAVHMFDSMNGVVLGNPMNGAWFLARTTDGGVTWAQFSTPPQVGGEIGYDNNFNWIDSQRGWFGTNKGRVYKTTNGGATWTSSTAAFLQCRGVSFVTSQLGIAGSVTGYTASSTDGNASWTGTPKCGSGNVFPAGISSPTPRWWATSGSRIYATTNQGINWRPEVSAAYEFTHLAVRRVHGNKIIALAVGYLGQIYKYVEALQPERPFITVGKKWNLVSVPVAVDDYRMATLFPTAKSEAFAFEGIYVTKSVLARGTGYWVKFDSTQSIDLQGMVIQRDTFHVRTGWNIIGSISSHLPLSAIASVPSGIVTSNYFWYGSAYAIADSITPGNGYWVKVNNDGSLILASPDPFPGKPSSNVEDPLEQCNILTFESATGEHQTLYFADHMEPPVVLSKYELPPQAPEGVFDVRFASQRMLEVADSKSATNLPIVITSASYPMTISWKVTTPLEYASLITSTTHIPMISNGSLQIFRPDKELTLVMKGLNDLPNVYALYQNYPNPFNPSTVITFDLPTQSRVTLTIYNILGEEVKRMRENELLDAGTYETTFDATALPSSMYFYRLQAGNVTFVRKLMFIK